MGRKRSKRRQHSSSTETSKRSRSSSQCSHALSHERQSLRDSTETPELDSVAMENARLTRISATARDSTEQVIPVIIGGNTASSTPKTTGTSEVFLQANSGDRGAQSTSTKSGTLAPIAQSLQVQGEPNISGQSVLFGLDDVSQLIQSIVKPSIQPMFNTNVNMIPEFDPSVKNHNIDLWLAKVNECAKIYKWDEAHIIHYALPKLVGNAKKWYQAQTSILHSWAQWQELLHKAFPCESNYGLLLLEMLERTLKYGESVDEYYYDKIMLLTACEIFGKKAADCIILGIEDRTIRAGASSARFTEPEDLLKYLKDVCKEHKEMDRAPYLSKNRQTNFTHIICTKCNKPGHKAIQCHENNSQYSQNTLSVVCFNCNEKGHRLQRCPKPIIKCEKCQRFGHSSTSCQLK